MLPDRRTNEAEQLEIAREPGTHAAIYPSYRARATGTLPRQQLDVARLVATASRVSGGIRSPCESGVARMSGRCSARDAGWPRPPRCTPRRRSSSQAWTPRAAVAERAQVRLVLRAQGEVPRLRHHERLLVEAARDQHQPFGGPGDEPVVGGERLRAPSARRARPRPAAAPARSSGPRAADRPRCSRAAAAASVGRPAWSSGPGRGGDRVHPGAAPGAGSCAGAAPGRAGRVDSRTASWATASPAPARTSSRVRVEPSSTALAWAPRSSDSAVVSGLVRRSPGRAAPGRSRPGPPPAPTARPRALPSSASDPVVTSPRLGPGLRVA